MILVAFCHSWTNENHVMPWNNSTDAQRFTKKATTPKLRRQWSDIANNLLSRGASESSAIRVASAGVAKAYRIGGRKVARGSKPKMPAMPKDTGRKKSGRK